MWGCVCEPPRHWRVRSIRSRKAIVFCRMCQKITYVLRSDTDLNQRITSFYGPVGASLTLVCSLSVKCTRNAQQGGLEGVNQRYMILCARSCTYLSTRLITVCFATFLVQTYGYTPQEICLCAIKNKSKDPHWNCMFCNTSCPVLWMHPTDNINLDNLLAG